jgi:CRISPR/Cas system-associated exonuclease Cas4 (RecB family)
MMKEKIQTEFLSFGTAVHEGIESLYETRDIQLAQRIFEEKLNELWSLHDHVEHDTFLDIGLIAITNIFQSGIIDREEFQHKEFEVMFPLRDNITFKGYVDLITFDPIKQKICIIDLKTTKNGWKDFQKKNIKTKAQLYLYLIFLSEMFQADPSMFECKFVLIEYNNDKIEEFVLDGNPQDIQKTRELLDSIIDALYYKKGNRYLKFKNKNNCRFCPYAEDKSICSDVEQDGFSVVTEYQLYNIYERTNIQDDRLLVLPWRDIDYTKKLDVSDWRDKILNEIHKKKPQTEEQQLYIDEDEEQLVQTESNEKANKATQEQKEARTSKNNEDSPKKKFNIYQERR